VRPCSDIVDPGASRFLERLVAWAKTQPGLLGAALVGSHARGTATAESDVDVLLLFRDPRPYVERPDWASQFGEPLQIIQEDWGKVTSVRVFYSDGLEVEYGMSDAGWGSDPQDEGDARVVADGLIVLYERHRHLSTKVRRFAGTQTPACPSTVPSHNDDSSLRR
jgi:hypothetical protein